MKKMICFVLSVLLISSVYAQDENRTFEKLTKYKYENVTIEGITWKGIRIRHSKGNRYITDKDLTAEDKKLLEKELKIWKEKLEKRNRRTSVRNRNRTDQEAELKELQKALPKMNSRAISNWFQTRIGTNPYKKEFKTKYFSAYAYAKNARTVMAACEKQLRTLETAEFNKMVESCLAGSVSAANGILKKKIGVPYTHANFTENLRNRFVWVPANVRNGFIREMNNRAKKEKICCFCGKEPSLTPGGYGKNCAAKVCTTCKKALAVEKEKQCEECKAGGSGGDAPAELGM